MKSPRRPAVRTRPTHPLGLAASACCVLLLLTSPAARAQSNWLQLYQPEQVLRFQPRTPDAARGLPTPSLPGQAAPGADPPQRFAARAVAASESGAWQEWGPPVRAGHQLVLDTRRHRLLQVGGDLRTDPQHSVWSFDPAASSWTPVSQWPTPALGAVFLGAVYDSARDRLLSLTFDGSLQLDGLTLAGTPAWSHVWTGPALAQPDFAGMAIDTRRGQLDLVGIWDPAAAGHRLLRVPLASPAAWTSELTSGAMPPVVRTGAAVYDFARDRLIVLFDQGTQGSSVWTLPANGTPAWTAFPPLPMFPCGTPRMLALDGAQDRLLIVDDTQVAREVPLGGGVSLRLDGPGCGDARNGSALAFDPASRRLYLSGGTRFGVRMPLFESLTADSGVVQDPGQPEAGTAGAWRTENPRGFGTHYWHSTVIDPIGARLVVFGGVPDNGAPPDLAASHPLDNSSGWTALGALSAAAPRARFMQSAAYDPLHHALLVFGGQATDGSGALLGDLWSLPLDAGGTWHEVTVTGPAPPARRNAMLFFDAARSRFLLMGGDNLASTFQDAWELTLGATPAWRPLAVTGTTGLPYPLIFADAARGDAWSVYNPCRIAHLTLGADEIHGDSVAVSGAPGAPRMAVAFDAGRRRLLGFSVEPVAGRAALNDAWSATLGATADWEPLAVTGNAPYQRVLFAASYDAASGHLVLSGGYDDEQTYFGDAWQMNLSQVVTVATALVSAESDARGVRLLWSVGSAPGSTFTVERSGDGQTWVAVGPAERLANGDVAFADPPLAAESRAAYRLRVQNAGAQSVSATVWLSGPDRPFAGLALAAARTPCDGSLDVRFTLAPGQPAQLRLLDVVGRVLREVNVPANATRCTLGDAPAPGIYFAELRQGAGRRTTKLVASR